jgi:hypothetical protein
MESLVKVLPPSSPQGTISRTITATAEAMQNQGSAITRSPRVVEAHRSPRTSCARRVIDKHAHPEPLARPTAKACSLQAFAA